MSVLLTAANVDAWYANPAYAGYAEAVLRAQSTFGHRAAALRQLNPALLGNAWLVAGCGFGHLLAEMAAAGFANVWGCDASTYAVQQAQALYPAFAARLLQGDVTGQASMDAVRAAAGLTVSTNKQRNQLFRGAVVEDVLPCLNGAEQQAALAVMRNTATLPIWLCSGNTPGDPSIVDQSLAWQPLAAWKTLVSPDNLVDPQGVVQ